MRFNLVLALTWCGANCVAQQVFKSDDRHLSAAEQRALVKPLCDESHGKMFTRPKSHGRGVEVGCSNCPLSLFGEWILGSVFLGHFTSPRSQDAFAWLAGCSDGDEDPDRVGPKWDYLGCILSKHGQVWRQAGFIGGSSPFPHRMSQGEPCHRTRAAEGRETLVCQGYSISEDYGSHDSYSVYALLFETGNYSQETIFAESNYDMDEVDSAKLIVREKIQSLEFKDLNGDGYEDITITVLRGRRLLTQAERDAAAPPKPEMGALKQAYTFDGRKFHLLTPAEDQ